MYFEVGKKYKVKVIRFVNSGIVVELEDKTTSLIHISQISSNFVESAKDFVTMGEEYEALGVEGKSKPVELSLKYLNLSKKTSEQIEAEDSNKSFAELLEEYNIDYSKKYNDIAEYNKNKRRDRIKNKNGHKGKQNRRFDY